MLLTYFFAHSHPSVMIAICFLSMLFLFLLFEYLHSRIYAQVNGQDVQGATHTRVVNIIKFGGDTVSLKVFSISPEEAARLKRIEDTLLEDKRRSMRVRDVYIYIYICVCVCVCNVWYSRYKRVAVYMS